MKLSSNPYTSSSSKDVTTPQSQDLENENEYGIPRLQDLGHDITALGEESFPGGEQEALRRLDEHMERKVEQFIHTYWIYMAAHSEAWRKIPEIYPEKKTSKNSKKEKQFSSYPVCPDGSFVSSL